MTGSMLSNNRRKLYAGALAVLVLSGAGAAWAQRDPAYAAARSGGEIGEKTDGYLGFVTPPAASLRALVDDLNIKRRAVYSERARATGATVEEYAFTSGCRLILQTSAGEKYQGPNGGWLTRGAGAPQRDSRCP
jgi:uncharacterized protein